MTAAKQALAKRLFSYLTRKAGTAAKYGTAGAIGGGLALGVNPFLGLMAGNAIRNMKWPGGKGKGLNGAAAAAAGGAAATRDTTITGGERAHSETKAVTLPVLSKKADFQTAINWLANATKLTYGMTVKNNAEIIHLQRMFQGVGAARAKELRMESQRKALVPIIYNTTIIQGGGGAGGGAGMGMLPGLGAAAAVIAGMVAGALGQDWRPPKLEVRTRGGRGDLYRERPGDRARYLEEERLRKKAIEDEKRRRIEQRRKGGAPRVRPGGYAEWLRLQERLRLRGGLGVEGGDPYGAEDNLEERRGRRPRIQRTGGYAEWLRQRALRMGGMYEGYRGEQGMEARPTRPGIIEDKARYMLEEDLRQQRIKYTEEEKRSAEKRRALAERYYAELEKPGTDKGPSERFKFLQERARVLRNLAKAYAANISVEEYGRPSEQFRLLQEMERRAALYEKSIKGRSLALVQSKAAAAEEVRARTRAVGAGAETFEGYDKAAETFRQRAARTLGAGLYEGVEGRTGLPRGGGWLDLLRARRRGGLYEGVEGRTGLPRGGGWLDALRARGTTPYGGEMDPGYRQSIGERMARFFRLQGVRSGFGGDFAFEGMEEGKLFDPLYDRGTARPEGQRQVEGKGILGDMRGRTGFEAPGERLIAFNERAQRFQIRNAQAVDMMRSMGFGVEGAPEARTGSFINTVEAIKMLDAVEGRTASTAAGYGRDRPGRRVGLKEKISAAKARQVNKMLSKLPSRVRSWIGTAETPGPLKGLLKDTGRFHHLPGPLNKWVNWAFAGVILWLLAQATWRYVSGEYGRNIKGNPDLGGWEAIQAGHVEYLKQMGNIVAIVGSAVFIWKMLEIVLNVSLNFVSGLIGTTLAPTGPVGWVITLGIFAGKFYLTGLILHTLEKQFGLPFDTKYAPSERFTEQQLAQTAMKVDYGQMYKESVSDFPWNKSLGVGGTAFGDTWNRKWRTEEDQSGGGFLSKIGSLLGISSAQANADTPSQTVTPAPTKTVSIPQTSISAISALGTLIMGGESAQHGYNAYRPGSKFNTVSPRAFEDSAGNPDLSQYNVGQIMRYQEDGVINAVGKYQLIETTLKMAVEGGALGDVRKAKRLKFNSATQDKLYRWILLKKRPTFLGAYLKGTGSTLEDAQIAMAKEWASIALPRDVDIFDSQGKYLRTAKKGESYYKGQRATIKASDIGLLLQQLQLAIMAQAAQSKEEASNGQTNIDNTVVIGGDSVVTAANTNFYPWKAHLEIPNQGLAYG